MTKLKKNYLVSKFANLGQPMVLLKPHTGESAKHFNERVLADFLKKLPKEKQKKS